MITSSSMEFHGIWSVPISLTRAVPWNSMELVVRQFRWHEQFHGIPWNSMELEMRQFRWHEQFHGIPWNLGCANFDDPIRSMEFHGIPWNLECANFDDKSSSMEFHGTWSAPIMMTRAVSWNYMELMERQFRWPEQFHGIPWNLECANFDDTSNLIWIIMRSTQSIRIMSRRRGGLVWVFTTCLSAYRHIAAIENISYRQLIWEGYINMFVIVSFMVVCTEGQ